MEREGRLDEAVADYRAALALVPGDGPTLRKATLCLLEANRGEEGVALCREMLRHDADNLTAKQGAEWLLTQMVPLWHIPMMNEHERNEAFHRGLQAAVTPATTVFEIGTGSGLVAMMAARLGAAHVVTCEAVPLIARTASRIVARNGLQDRVKVLAKPSHEVQIGGDELPAKADLLVREIFSSELLGEHVLQAIEDAKARLLRSGGRILPSAASIMVALVGGDDLERNLFVGESFGFDLSEFNAIHPKRRPVYREDLAPVLLSAPHEAFRFDFQKRSTFPAERKRLTFTTTQDGRCAGLIQWIRIELGDGVVYENHPVQRRMVSNWQHTVYGMDTVRRVAPGDALVFDAWHDRARPWFELAAA
jgi:predicted RNA methylase